MEEIFDFEMAWNETDNYGQQEKTLINGFEKTISRFGLDHSYTKSGLGDMANFYEAYGKMDRLFEVYGNYVERLEQLGNSLGLIDSLCQLACFYQMQRKYDEAEQIITKALIVSEDMHLEDRERTSVLDQMAVNYFMKGDYPQAQVYYQRLLDLYETIDGDSDRYRRTLYMLAATYQYLGNRDGARFLYTELLDLCNDSPKRYRVFISEINNELINLV